MKYLLDTQVLIWWFESSPHLSKEFKSKIESKNIKFVSVASVWEMVIKIKTKKLKLGKSLAFLLKNMGFSILEINLKHILELENLPDYHKDPFDRILISQAQSEDCELLTSDKQIQKYFNN